MSIGDFYGSEQSVVLASAGDVRTELVQESGERIVLKDKITLHEGKVLDSTVMSSSALKLFF